MSGWTRASARRAVTLLAALAAVAQLWSAAVLGQGAGSEEVTQEVLVQFKPGVDAGRRAAVRAPHAATVLRAYNALRVERLRLRANASPAAIARLLAADPDVAAAQPNYIRHTVASPPPNDPYWLNGGLWGLEKITAGLAWTNFGPGNDTVVVADIDSGADYTHPDLAAHMWRNPGEIAGNGIDDDQDGYIDDVYGINAITGSGNPLDDHGHGSHTSGTIGAVSNNGIGIAGVAQNVRVLACKFIGADGSGSDADAVECFNYVVAQKQRGVNVRVTNSSWGSFRGSQFPTVLKNAIDAAGNAGIVNVVAAGNYGVNIDTTPFNPASFTSPSVVTVAASDPTDARADFSDFGVISVDLAAPGVGIMSTLPGGNYASWSGTSMATPHVAGAAALLLSHESSLTVAEVKARLLASADRLAQWNGVVASGGRLDLLSLLSGNVINAPPTVSMTSPAANAAFTAPAQVVVAASANDSDGSISKVVFYSGSTLLGTDTSAPYQITWSNVSAGTYSLTAVATDDRTATTTSSPVTFTVFPATGSTQTLLTGQVPASTNTSSSDYELGVRVTSPTAGTIQAIRFWKVAGETSAHVGRVWSAAGQLLASVSFAGETASGWQQQALTSPLAMTANTEYLVSVNTTNGLFAATQNAFDAGLVNGALRAIAGNNGRYGLPGLYPTATYAGANYFRDLVFAASSGGTDTVAPTVTLTQPANGTTVSGSISLTATATDNVGVAGVQFKVDGVNVGSEVTVAPYTVSWATTSVSDGSHTVTATARDAAGNTTPASATVTVANGGVATQTLLTAQVPAATYASSADFELGVRVMSNRAGSIQAIRFWKVVGETSAHVGHVWSATGQLLATVTFTGESASGWQQQALTTPLAMAANTEYLVSVNTTNSLFAATLNAFDAGLVNGALQAVAGSNGRYGTVGQYPTTTYSGANYFRDLVFAASGGSTDTVAPTVTLTQPANGTTVSGSISLTATATDNVGVAGVQFKVDGVNVGSEATVAPYTASWATTSVSDGSHTITATARDAAGNTTTASATVTVANGGVATQTLLTTQVPAATYASSADFELGVRVMSNTAGSIQAIRFWKVAGETSVHVGHVWSATGQLLATVTFTGESASGWQQQALTTPLAMAANTEYLVSVNTTNSLFAATLSVFDGGLVNGVLQAVAGSNGRYGTVGQYPTSTYAGANYFRDLVFAPSGN